MFAFEVFGGADRRASEYYFQPVGKSPLPGKVAYTNSIYYANAISSMVKNPPTQLIQVGVVSCLTHLSDACKRMNHQNSSDLFMPLQSDNILVAVIFIAVATTVRFLNFH